MIEGLVRATVIAGLLSIAMEVLDVDILALPLYRSLLGMMLCIAAGVASVAHRRS